MFHTDRPSRGSCYQWHIGSHSGTAGHPELLRQLLLPLHTSSPAVDLGEGSPDKQHQALGGAHSPTGPSQADIADYSVLHCVTHSETQAQM